MDNKRHNMAVQKILEKQNTKKIKEFSRDSPEVQQEFIGQKLKVCERILDDLVHNRSEGRKGDRKIAETTLVM